MTRRVALVADSDAWGGAEVYLTHLAERAAANGWTPSVVAAEPVAARFAACTSVPVTAAPLARHRADAGFMVPAIARQQPDAVVVNLVDPGSNLMAVRAAFDVAPTVGVLHLPGAVTPGLAQTYQRLRAVVTPSPDGRRQLITQLGVPAERVSVIPNGVEVPAECAALPTRPVPRIGAVGRLTAQKGFDVLVEAVRLLTAAGASLEVVVAGAGREESALRSAAAGLPITFCGFLHDVRPFLRTLDVFCLPSRREALPLALLEAMAEGRPCVATDVGGVAAVVGEAAVVVAPEEPQQLAGALARLLRSRDDRVALGARAHRLAQEQMQADLMARRTFEVLDRALRAEPGGMHGAE